jgi:hypothetical protein
MLLHRRKAILLFYSIFITFSSTKINGNYDALIFIEIRLNITKSIVICITLIVIAVLTIWLFTYLFIKDRITKRWFIH